jgi:plasmid stabilization system protein ParE
MSQSASDELDDIWAYNAANWSIRQADSYDQFLKSGIQKLGSNYETGRKIKGLEGLRGIALKRRTKGDGHFVVYQVDRPAGVITVLHIYHTKMDIHGKLDREF